MNSLFNKTRNMAVRIFGLLLMLTAAVSFSSCSTDNDPFFTATEDDAPRFLNSDLPKVDDKGELGSFGTILRTNNFKFGVIATPVDYTTITWYIDDELVYTGDTIDQKVLAGDHIVKVVATTTKGLSCYRLGKLTVNPLDSDPQLGNKQKERWVAPGATTTIKNGKNLESITKVYVGDKEVEFTINGNDITLTAPNIAEGIYHITLEDNEGKKFGANKITISSEESPYKEDVIWEDKPFNVTWDTPFKEFKNNWKEYLKVGTILRVYVSKTGNNNGQGCAATSWWTNIVTGGKDDNRGDTIITGDDVLTFVISQSSIDLLTEQEGLYIVGNGYTIKKITIE